MARIIKLPDNFIGKEDRERLESFGGHEISRGRATRWHWNKDKKGNDIFEIYRGGADEKLVICISRNREHDEFYAKTAKSKLLASGTLDHIMNLLDEYFAKLHGETGDEKDPA